MEEFRAALQNSGLENPKQKNKNKNDSRADFLEILLKQALELILKTHFPETELLFSDCAYMYRYVEN